tara:strand:- start:1243 stop:2304 length:1062 start_codon:yes stop_codon:yes gene_type:complete
MSIKKIFSLAASIISFFIFLLFNICNSNAEGNNIKYYSKDSGILSLMYHRFNENKYPSTNIRMEIFKQQMDIIKELDFEFYDPNSFVENFYNKKDKKKILITIDDGFKSFYEEAWPYLKEKKIPFILFISTEPVGKNGYMTWEEIKEIDDSKFGYIGHHSHTHKYLIDMTDSEFINDIETSTKIFKDKLGYVPLIFSYPFGEYSLFQKNYISKNFKFAFGQHSGVIDINKDEFEFPRFPINEKYGELKRFRSLVKYSPLEYKVLKPEEKKIGLNNNPPKMSIEFFDDQKNLENITCYSNDGGNWKKTKLILEKNILNVVFEEAFKPRRGRINCSLNDNGEWRWFGAQFVISKN